MIEYEQMEGCCVAVILSNFGGSRNRYDGNMSSKEDMLRQLKDIGLEEHNGGYELKKLAVVQAYLTTEQTTANEVLEEIGFTKTGTFKKEKHPEDDLNAWQIAAPKFQEWAEQYQPATPARQGRFAQAPAAPPPQAPPPVVNTVWDEDFEEEDM